MRGQLESKRTSESNYCSRVAVELLSDPVVSTKRLSSVISVGSVRVLPFLPALLVLRGKSGVLFRPE